MGFIEQWIVCNQELIVDLVYYSAIFMMFETCRVIMVLCDWLDFWQHPKRNSVMVVLVPCILILVAYGIHQFEAIGL